MKGESAWRGSFKVGANSMGSIVGFSIDHEDLARHAKKKSYTRATLSK